MLLCSDIYYVVAVDDDREDVTWLNLNIFDVVFPSLIDVMPQVFIYLSTAIKGSSYFKWMLYLHCPRFYSLSLPLFQTNLLKRKQSEGKMVLLGSNLNLSLATQSTSLVNSIPIAFTVANVPILLATLATNIWAIQIIQRKETSRINRFFFNSNQNSHQQITPTDSFVMSIQG